MAFSTAMSRSISATASVRTERGTRRQLHVLAASTPDESRKQRRAAQAAGLLAAAQLLSASAALPPTLAAGLDTSTYKAGPGAKIEASDISSERPAEVVRKLQDEVLPRVQEVLSDAANSSGGKYPKSVVQELGVVKDEINSLVKQVAEDGDSSNILSAASGIEQQINALKAILGFD